MRISLLCFTVVVLFSSCFPKEQKDTIKQTVEDFCKIYSERKDFERFMNFYAQEVIFEDIVNGDRLLGKKAVRSFFDWGNPNYSKTDSNTLVITDRIIEADKAVIIGCFTGFKWGDIEYEAMHFMTVLKFNKAGLIIKQTDWINYPATLVDYTTRKNSNLWIKKN